MSKEYIDKGRLYQKIAELEEIARTRYLDTSSDDPEYERYMAQMNERTSFKHLVADFPAADVAEVVHGEWIECDCYDPRDTWIKCNLCGHGTTILMSKKYNYCPNCGAKMDGGKANE